MATPGAANRIEALPIWLLVLAALSLGTGIWYFIALPPDPRLGVGLLLVSILLFLTAAWILRDRRAHNGEHD